MMMTPSRGLFYMRVIPSNMLYIVVFSLRISDVRMIIAFLILLRFYKLMDWQPGI